MRICAKCGELVKKTDYALVQRNHDIPRKKLPNLAKMRAIKSTNRAKLAVRTNKNRLYLMTRPNRAVFYFAAQPRDFVKPTNSYPTAYGNYSNSGHTISDSRGRAEFNIKCPQSYERDGKTYPRHIHYMISNRERTKWLPKIYTTALICDVDKSTVRKYLKSALIIDALPAEYYNKRHIPGAINMYHMSARHYTNAKVASLVRAQLPEKLRKYKSPKLCKKVPIIVYCYSHECGAARDLVLRLYRAGFHNVLHYAGGVTDWFGKK
jgi:rhodanese-related sulfurtransferase